MRLGAVRSEVAKAVVGQDAAVSGLLVALLCGGHVLMEGVPGVAKTLLVRSLAAALSVQTTRVQFTPDLMPGDITGSMVIDGARGELTFREGPVFTNLLLADEINRTPPKTQSALLEAMEEGQVSVDGVSHPLPRPFLVAATQNPVEYEGTYPLPEAQLDRFLLKVVLPVPERAEELEIVRRHAAGFDPHDVVASGRDGGRRRLRHRGRPPRRGRGPAVSGGRRLRRRRRPGDAAGAVPRAGRQPARRGLPDAYGARLGLALGPRLRDARRRQGARPGHPRPPAVPAARGRARGRRRERRARLRAGLGRRSRASSMAITGRVPLLLLLGLVAVVLRPTVGTVWLWVLVVGLVTVLDVALAPSPRSGHRGATARRPGASGSGVREHARGRQRRDAGVRRSRCATRGSRPPAPPATDTGSGSVRATTASSPPPCGRPGAASSTRSGSPCAPWVRSAWRLGRPRARSPGRVRSVPPFDSRKHLPSRLARLRDLDGRSAVRVRGQGTEFDSLREYVRGDDVRSIDWRASARNRTVVVRTWQPERDRRVVLVLDTSRVSAGRVDDVPRLDSAMEAALLLTALAVPGR